jgi:hypothetical protein
MWVLATGTATAATFKDHEVNVSTVPGSVEDFVMLRDALARTPEGSAAAFAVALLKFVEDEKTGSQFLTAIVQADKLVDSKTGYKGKAPHPNDLKFIQGQVGSKPYVIRSLVMGTGPTSDYGFKAPFVIKVREQPGDVKTDTAKVFIYCSGADTPRPVSMRKNDKGLWKVNEWSSLLVGIRPPAAAAPKDDL